MAHLREETLNTYLALLLDGYKGITATAERRSSTEAVDITVVHGNAAASIPILIEAKIGDTPAKRREAAKQARTRLVTAPNSLAFGLCYPIQLRDGAVSSKTTQRNLAESTIAFAPVQLFAREATWREGSVADLADSLRNADLSRQRIADVIEHTVREVAAMLFDYGCAPALASALALPKTSKDLRAAPLVAALMLSNAALLHHRLRLVPSLAGIVQIESAQKQPYEIPPIIREAWQAILAIDFHPVFAPALAALNALSDDDAREPMRWIVDTAVGVADELASLRFDHAGSLYHRLLASAKYDGSYYTNNVSAMLLARLALTENMADWSNPNDLANLKIIDPACGTGTLLMAAMHAIRDRHENAAGAKAESSLLHLALVEDVLYGLDINRHGIQLAACNLTLGNPRVDYRRMNLFTMQHGPQPKGRDEGRIVGIPRRCERRVGHRNVLFSPLPTTGRPWRGTSGTRGRAQRVAYGAVRPRHHEPTVHPERYPQSPVQYTRDRRSLQEREIEIAEFLRKRDFSAFRAIDQTGVSNHSSRRWRTHS